MSRRSAFVVDVRLEDAGALADRIDSISAKALLRLSAVDAVNDVATRFDVTARQAMNAGLNLSDDYIASRMSVQRASDTPRATITARGDLTILSRYPHAQLTQPARSGRARGDPSRGIPAGRKQAGVAVEIKTAAATDQPKWFLMRLKNGNGVGVFVRTATGLRQIYGPSPYSLFRFQIEQRQEALADDLQTTGARHASDAINKALS